MLFYAADFIHDRHTKISLRDKKKAKKYCIKSIKIAESLPLLKRDPEILGNSYRLLGDINLMEENYDFAAAHYFRASFYAYAFQGIPNFPDDYTLKFYKEITDKVSSNIFRVFSTDEDAGESLLNAIKSYWEPYWKIIDISKKYKKTHSSDLTIKEISTYLFPKLLSHEDSEAIKKLHGTDFQEKIQSVVDDLSPSFTKSGRKK
jgi:hypothetical protein